MTEETIQPSIQELRDTINENVNTENMWRTFAEPHSRIILESVLNKGVFDIGLEQVLSTINFNEEKNKPKVVHICLEYVYDVLIVLYIKSIIAEYSKKYFGKQENNNHVFSSGYLVNLMQIDHYFNLVAMPELMSETRKINSVLPMEDIELKINLFYASLKDYFEEDQTEFFHARSVFIVYKLVEILIKNNFHGELNVLYHIMGFMICKENPDENQIKKLIWKDHVVIAFFIKLLSDIDDGHVHSNVITFFRDGMNNSELTEDDIAEFKEIGHKACLSLLMVDGIYLHDCLVHEKNRKDPQGEEFLNKALQESREAYNQMYDKLYQV